MNRVNRGHLAGLLLVDELDGTVAISDLIAQASAAPELEPFAYALMRDGDPAICQMALTEDAAKAWATPGYHYLPLYTHPRSAPEQETVDDEQWWADTPDGDAALVMRVAAHADQSEIERLRAELEARFTAEEHERLVAKGQKLNSAYISKLEQKLAEALALLRESREAYAEAIHWEDQQPAMKKIDAFLSATAQPAECAYPPLSTWPQWANWCGLSAAGYWVFYECEPVTSEHGRKPNGGFWGKPIAGEQQPNWAVMIYRRPAQPAECQHRYMYFGTQPARRCADCNKVEPAEVKS